LVTCIAYLLKKVIIEFYENAYHKNKLNNSASLVNLVFVVCEITPELI